VIRIRIRIASLALALALVGCSAASDDALGTRDDAQKTLPSLDAASDRGLLGYGDPVSAPIEVAGDAVSIFRFEGRAGDRVLASARPEALSNAVFDLWIVDATNKVVASRGDARFLDTTLPADGAFRVVVREAQKRRARFTFALNAFVPAPSATATWIHPRAGGEDLRAVLVRSDADVWAAGERGVLVHWDGATLKRFDSGVEDTLETLWAAGPDDVWAAGGRSLVHVEGTKVWRMPRGGAFTLDVQGSGASDVWLLEGVPRKDAYPGWEGQRLARFDGERWTASASDAPGRGFPASGRLVVDSTNDAWLFGSKIARWDGLSWVEQRVGFLEGTFLSHVTRLADGTMLAAGGTHIQPQIWAWDGAAWKSDSWEGIYGGGSRITGIWGTSALDLWAVNGAGMVFARRGIAGAYNKFEPSPGAPKYVTAIHGVTAGAPWLAARGGQLHRRAVGTFASVAERALLGCDAPVSGASSEAWIACGSELVRREGTAWVRRPVDVLVADEVVTTAWAESADRVWMITSKGAVVRYDTTATPASRIVAHVANARAIWGASSSEVWLVGTSGALLRGGEAGFAEAPGDDAPEGNAFVVGSTSSNVLAISPKGGVQRWNGQAWTALPAPALARDIRRVRLAGGVLTALTDDAVLRWTGAAWQESVRAEVTDAWVNADGTVDAVTRGGRLGRWSGTAWTYTSSVPPGRLVKGPTWSFGARGGVAAATP
jgi:hypothetical protein